MLELVAGNGITIRQRYFDIDVISSAQLSSWKLDLKLATAIYASLSHTAFVSYSVTAGCSLTGSTHDRAVLPVLYCLTSVTF